jgi:hypothetical protein
MLTTMEQEEIMKTTNFVITGVGFQPPPSWSKIEEREVAVLADETLGVEVEPILTTAKTLDLLF